MKKIVTQSFFLFLIVLLIGIDLLDHSFGAERNLIFSSEKKIKHLFLNVQPDTMRESRDFKTFLTYFINQTYSNNNFDSLIYVSSPLINEFIDSKIGFGRFSNPGVYCSLFEEEGWGYNFYEGYKIGRAHV